MDTLPDENPKSPCDNIPAVCPVIDEETVRSHTLEANVLPLYEKWEYDYVRRKNYAMPNNELLRSQWREYLDNLQTRSWTPIQFPTTRDYHFKNYLTVYSPSLSVKDKNYRKQFSDQQAFACRGNAPDAHEMYLRKPVLKPRVTSVMKVMPKTRDSSLTSGKKKMPKSRKLNNEFQS